MVMNSFEELTAGNPRHSASITLRTGVDPDAKLLAIEAQVIFNAGAYAGFVPVPTLHGGYAELAGTYRVPNCSIEVLRVYTNTVPCGHMRAPRRRWLSRSRATSTWSRMKWGLILSRCGSAMRSRTAI
jgi:CO/xanthine dehydrogenase Mo-binding subunit